MDIKEESCFLNFCCEIERDAKHLVKKVKIETAISSSDVKPERGKDSTCSQTEEYHLMRFSETIEGSEIETKIDIKEHCWLEREDLCINDIKDESHKELDSAKRPCLYKESVSTSTSDLSSGEDLGNYLSFNMKKDGLECGSGRKYESQKRVVTDIFSIETNVCTENSDKGKIVSMGSSLKQRKLLEQSNTDKQDISEENSKSTLSQKYRKSCECDVSKKCFRYPSHLKKCRLVLDSKKTNNNDEGGKTHKCTMCNKSFTRLQRLKAHKLNHEGINPNKCKICNKAFTELSNLKKHKWIHDGTSPHKCNICKKAFTQLSDLKTHNLIHEGIRPHKCSICNKAFTQLSNLKSHELIHEGIKPHKCNICNKAFTQLSNLKRHKLIHEGTEQQKCNICNKAFTLLSNLKRHKLIHQAIQPHQCNICNRAFNQLSHLEKHKLIHEGIERHKCNICDKDFTRSSTLKTHKLIHEGIKPHKCNICNKTFTRLSDLKRHILIHQHK